MSSSTRPRDYSEEGLESNSRALLLQPERTLLRRAISDSLLYTHYLPPPNPPKTKPSSEDSVPSRQTMSGVRIIEWLDRQGDTITNPALMSPPPVIDLRFLRRPQPCSRREATPSSDARRSSRRTIPVPNRPDELQGIRRFTDDPGMELPTRRLRRRHRPLTGWFNLWL